MNSRYKPLHVLLVEDCQDDADLILLQLSEAGYELASKRVDNEAAMREAMMASRWDIVISDFNLPGFSAHEAMAVLNEAGADVLHKNDRRLCPFIVVSGCIGEESAVALLKQGASDVVMKDKLLRLAPVVERALKGSAARQERRQAQDALRANEKLLSGITSALGEGLLVLNKEGKLLFINPEAERLLGWTERELSGHEICKIICSPKQDGTPLAESGCGLLGVLKNGGIFKTDDKVFWRKDGSFMPVSIVISAIMEEDKAVASVVIFKDISQRKRADQELLESREQLRELTSYLQTVREEERTRIARELHDELGQMLTGVKLDAMWLATYSDEYPAIAGKIASMFQLIDETLDAMRRVASDLRPVMLDDLGLAAAVEWQAEEFGKRTGISMHLELDLAQEDEINTEVVTAIFRIVQESLTNVARHAEAKHVLISLDCCGGKLMLLLSDDGKGMPAAGESKRDSYGIIGMRERAHSLGGTLQLLSIPGKGSSVVAIIPFNPVGFQGELQ